MSIIKLSPTILSRIKGLVFNEMTTNPPTIGIVGVSGVGKSSTLNVLFKTNLPTSDTISCTKEFTPKNIRLVFKKGKNAGTFTSLIVIDAPGLGEDLRLDGTYLKMYRENLHKCDVIIWVMTGKNRAVALDQLYLKELAEFRNKMVFAINQVELIEPQAWDNKLNIPLKDQIENISIVEKDKKEKLESFLGEEISICSYSAHKKYNLELLFGNIIAKCPAKRKWIFDGLKNFHYSDFLPEELKIQLNIKS